ncbi:MAG TPA: guanine deaminase [Bryobacteraceae bacterium]|nr:guanine deaminase [Bryobacteraceae bacterium]
MSSSGRGELLRAHLFHTPRNPFRNDRGLESYSDGGLLIRAGKVVACGEYSEIHEAYSEVPTIDLRGGFLLPGFIDTHIHFPQLHVLGGLGRQLLDWLEYVALPEEARMAEPAYACETARAFVNALAAHGTTTALVFGAHFAGATASLFEAAEKSGLRIVSGMVLSDRWLRPELHQLPADAYRESTDLIRRFHGRGRLLYAVTPRFALSTSEAMLEVCQTLLRENPGVRFQTHLNENRQEIAEVAQLFPWASDYLNVYERFQLGGRGAVMAHNVHPSDSEVERLAASGTAISHCPCSNAALGSGLFPLRRHIAAGVTCALGTDVGGGTGFGMHKEGLQAYLLQRLAPDGVLLSPAHLLYLATRAGAEALGLDEEIGDFNPGKAADLVYLRPPQGSPLAAVIEQASDADRILAALFTLGGAESVREVRVEGAAVYRSPA